MNHYRKKLEVEGKEYYFFCINTLLSDIGCRDTNIPFSSKILLENLLRYQVKNNITDLGNLRAIVLSIRDQSYIKEIPFFPSRVLMQDFTGIPALVDLAAMRNALKNIDQDPNKINPKIPVDLVIDHSVQVDFYGNSSAFDLNAALDMKRNFERYSFLKWAQNSFKNLTIIPPETGICHQINLEKLAQVVFRDKNVLYPDTVVGTDSHTTMINALSVLGWGVGGIEAEAAMLGQPVSMLIPEIIGCKLTGNINDGVTATDIVLYITNVLRKKGVVGKFVEFYGSSVQDLSLSDRATISNMAPEYGATASVFPIDEETIKYLHLTGRSEQNIKIITEYAKVQGIFRDENWNPKFSDVVDINLSDVRSNIAGPKRPQDKINISDAKNAFYKIIEEDNLDKNKSVFLNSLNTNISHGDVVIASITSCTNTSNPSLLITAGLVARNAFLKGLKIKSFVKTSFTPGSKVVSEYMNNSGLQKFLDKIGFNIVGYGCGTCIGNSGRLHEDVENAIKESSLTVVSVLSGNRNFEGRINPLTKANYLASPPLVIAYALAGTMKIDLSNDPIGFDKNKQEVYLKDIWPSSEEIKEYIDNFVNRKIFLKGYKDLLSGSEKWRSMNSNNSVIYNWNKDSTYIKCPNFFKERIKNTNLEIKNARIVAILGDSVTTDHISPAGNIAKESPAAEYLLSKGVKREDFNSYGSRRGNHELMTRGTFANIRIKNEMLNKEGGYTKLCDKIVTIYDAAMEFKQKNTSLIIFAGKEYGTGSSRDWAAKGTNLLGIKAIVAESFERIHRSNLVGMGILPVVFTKNDNRLNLNLKGDEIISLYTESKKIIPKQIVKCKIRYTDGSYKEIELLSRIDTNTEVEYYKSGGILSYVLDNI